MPLYKNKKILKDKLMISLDNSEGFGLMWIINYSIIKLKIDSILIRVIHWLISILKISFGFIYLKFRIGNFSSNYIASKILV